MVKGEKMANEMQEIQRELKHYEYRVKATLEYCSHIGENWELVDVFPKRLESGQLSYLFIFRKDDFALRPPNTPVCEFE